MRTIFFLLFILNSTFVFSQKKEINFDAIDSLYREDQFYINFTYNSLQNKPDGINQNKLSPGIALGFLRDMPINKKRTVAFAAGLGYTLAIYNQNLGIKDLGGTIEYQKLGDITSYTTNKLSLHTIDLPIEFRWRNSTYESHKFWRIYTGLKLSYLLYDLSKQDSSNGEFYVSHNKDLNKFQYGAYLSVGWNTWNFYAFYGIQSLFASSAQLENQSVRLNTANFGIMFYIL